MPPTVAAARMTASGRVSAAYASTSLWDRKSRLERGALRISHGSGARRRTTAEPTIPRCAGSQTRRPSRENKGFSSAAIVVTPRFLFQDFDVRQNHLAHHIRKGRPV